MPEEMCELRSASERETLEVRPVTCQTETQNFQLRLRGDSLHNKV